MNLLQDTEIMMFLPDGLATVITEFAMIRARWSAAAT
jgi:hypothetical protein